MEKEWDMIEILRHSRHDWLNKLQLIKGNLDLNRIERAKEVINQIVIEAQHETKLSNLPMPQFVTLLLRTNWENRSFQLEYEIFEDPEYITVNDKALTDWTSSFFTCLDQSVEVFQENHLSITIEPQSDGIRFFFDFSGIIINRKLIEQFLDQTYVPDMELEIKEFTENELTLESFLPAL
ncbi:MULTISPECIES: sporulation initiation phosphotransferase B [Neobacillus]|jgi:stage 0 sporulation protein B (sporulation initiation phosphotransferase)|uniref:Sporulation initiation phosphotransferase B n=1 Tax=Neobacillus sedimentimangrovi TaxID=2699460 RepID=A0ABS8QHG3_9BACI|nr:sporulation initiation phosphotransferase B [Neobacillus sedimentimangrovi]AIM15751.1 sporulation protein [Bacillus sp. X1(2014)]MCD4838699.1 sporulation initiation phosphotransferase B [Neobacillus sedimentimangrovi]